MPVIWPLLRSQSSTSPSSRRRGVLVVLSLVSARSSHSFGLINHSKEILDFIASIALLQAFIVVISPTVTLLSQTPIQKVCILLRPILWCVSFFSRSIFRLHKSLLELPSSLSSPTLSLLTLYLSVRLFCHLTRKPFQDVQLDFYLYYS